MATAPLEGRVPPHNLDAEASVLGSVLLDSEVLDRLEGTIAPDAFYKEAHRKIWEGMITLRQKRDPVDLVTISEELRIRGELENIGGLSYLVGLSEATPTAAYADYYARIVSEKWTLRKLITATGEAMKLAYDEEGSLEDILDTAGRKVLEVSSQGAKSDFQSMKDLVQDTFEHIQQLFENQGQVDGVRSGFRELDSMIGGLGVGSLNIIAARPSMGKCLTANMLLDVPGTGERLRLEDYIRRQIKCVYGIAGNGLIRPSKISAWIDSGIKPVWRVTTRTGRSVEVTGHHPFLSVDGWTPLHDLKLGDHIAVPRTLPVFGKDTLPLGLVRLLAYLIAEGNLTNTSPRFTNTDPVLVKDFKQIIAEHFPELQVRQSGIDYVVARGFVPGERKNRPNPLTQWLRELGLMGKNAGQKSFPGLVWRLDAEHLAEFLRILFSCDGTVYALSNTRQVRIEFTLASEQLAKDVHHALVRFGIVSKLWRKTARSWRVEITEPGSVALYYRRIGWLGEKAQRQFDLTAHPKRSSKVGHLPASVWEGVRACAAQKNLSLTQLARLAGEKVPAEGYNPHRSRGLTQKRLEGYAKILQDPHLTLLASPDLYWDTIASIAPIGEQQVYDLTVPDGSNFIAQDICVHNTAFALTIAQNVALKDNIAVAIFSLEMPSVQLVTRMLCSEARIDMNRLRQGHLTDRDFSRLVDVAGRISEAPIYIDDTSDMTLMELRSRARRLHTQHKLGLVVIDYMQLMSGPNAARNAGENRQQEIAQISRGLKGLARELGIPVVALSQLSRAVEARPNKRPMLSDLRESGCLTGDSLVQLADGSRTPIRDLIGRSDFEVVALNEKTQKLKPARASRAFSTGTKPVFELSTQLGRSIKATANHKFLTSKGWKRLDEIRVGDYLALPRIIPAALTQTLSDAELALLGHLIGDGCTLARHTIEYTTRETDLAQTVADLAKTVFGDKVSPRVRAQRPWFQVYLSSTQRLTHGKRNPVAVWLENLGAWGLRSYEKRVPDEVFNQPAKAISRFLRHLWSTDGCILLHQGQKPYPAVYYASSSEGLAHDVQSLLLYLGINAGVKRLSQKAKGRDQFRVIVSGRTDLLRFVEQVGAVGLYKQNALAEIKAHQDMRIENTNRDVIPLDLWLIPMKMGMAVSGMSHHELHKAPGMAYSGMTLFKQNLSHERTFRVANAIQSEVLEQMAHSDIYWDSVVSTQPMDEEEVFDLTVPGPHNFVANNLIVHNSIEQDADLVMFIYRDDYYNQHSEKAGTAEIIIGKQRNGPTGTAELQFHAQHVRFNDLAKDEV